VHDLVSCVAVVVAPSVTSLRRTRAWGRQLDQQAVQCVSAPRHRPAPRPQMRCAAGRDISRSQSDLDTSSGYNYPTTVEEAWWYKQRTITRSGSGPSIVMNVITRAIKARNLLSPRAAHTGKVLSRARSPCLSKSTVAGPRARGRVRRRVRIADGEGRQGERFSEIALRPSRPPVCSASRCPGCRPTCSSNSLHVRGGARGVPTRPAPRRAFSSFQALTGIDEPNNRVSGDSFT